MVDLKRIGLAEYEEAHSPQIIGYLLKQGEKRNLIVLPEVETEDMLVFSLVTKNKTGWGCDYAKNNLIKRIKENPSSLPKDMDITAVEIGEPMYANLLLAPKCDFLLTSVEEYLMKLLKEERKLTLEEMNCLDQ
jgi:hypothetical protein